MKLQEALRLGAEALENTAGDNDNGNPKRDLEAVRLLQDLANLIDGKISHTLAGGQ